jgi:hypothetical protein
VDKTFFVDGLGGAGKTFLYGCLLSKVRSTCDITLSVASSSIAALLLEGGCIAHSRFKIPIAGLCGSHSYDILGARMLWKPKEARILKNLKKIYRSTSVIW